MKRSNKKKNTQLALKTKTQNLLQLSSTFSQIIDNIATTDYEKQELEKIYQVYDKNKLTMLMAQVAQKHMKNNKLQLKPGPIDYKLPEGSHKPESMLLSMDVLSKLVKDIEKQEQQKDIQNVNYQLFFQIPIQKSAQEKIPKSQQTKINASLSSSGIMSNNQNPKTPQ